MTPRQPFNKMSLIQIHQLIGTPNAIIQKFGLQVFDEASKHLSKGEEVVLSFHDLRNATTGFFNASIGNIYKNFPDTVEHLLKLEGIDSNSDWQEKIDEAIALVRDPAKAKALDQAIAALFF